MRAGSDAIISTIPVYYDKCESAGSSKYFPGKNFGNIQKTPGLIFPSPQFSYHFALSFINFPTKLRMVFEDFRIEDDDTYNETNKIYSKYGIEPILEFGILRLYFIFDGSMWLLDDFSIGRTPVEEPVLFEGPDIQEIMDISRRFIVDHIQKDVNTHFKTYYEDYLNHARNYCACILSFLDALENAYKPRSYARMGLDDLNHLLCEVSYGRHHLGNLYWIEPHPTIEDAGFYRPVEDLQEQIDRLRAHYLLYQLYLEADRYAVPPDFPPDFSDEVPEEFKE